MSSLKDMYRTVLKDTFPDTMTITLGAAVTLLLFMVGLRVGELVRLDVDCLEEQESPTGLPITFIKGVAAKASGRKRRWVAGEPLPSVIEPR